jgi:opacity protein-like surface antigen
MFQLKVKALIVSIVFVAFSTSALAEAAINLGSVDFQANVGVAHILPEGSDSITGVGFDMIVGLPIGMGLVPELMVGYLSNESNGVTLNNLMAMGGLRFDIPLPIMMLTPYVYGHVGLCNLSTSIGSFSTDTTSELGMNLGAGARFMIADTIGVGVSAGPVFIFGEGGTTEYIRANLSGFISL